MAWSAASGSMSKPEENPFSPYFLHVNENPTLVLVSSVLTGPNYHQWQRVMRMSLLSKNKLSFVDGSILQPSRSDSLFVPWERCNNLVISWIMHSVSPSIAQSIIWLDSAYEIWQDLKARFAQSNSFRICDLQLEIYTCQQGGLSVHEYFTRL